MKILIVDDDQAINDLWNITFKNVGFETLSASLAQQGIDIAKTQKPDFILLDQIMPDMKGNDVLKMLKADPMTQSIPIALVSNYNDKQLMQEAIQAGAIDYILKYQVEPEDLVNKVKNLLQESQNAQKPN